MKRISLTCLLALLPVMASANITTTVDSISGTGPYVWTYNFQLSRDQNAESGLQPVDTTVPHVNRDFGSFLTVYDFAGYVAGSCTGPAGWLCTAQSIGFTPDDVVPLDNASLINLTWVYTSGPTLVGFPDGRDLGLFSATSIYDTSTEVSYAARGVKSTGLSAGTIADNVGRTRGPTEVSEPGSLALAGMALLLLVGRTLPKRRAASGVSPLATA